jgi:choline-glycine betaine transporter
MRSSIGRRIRDTITKMRIKPNVIDITITLILEKNSIKSKTDETITHNPMRNAHKYNKPDVCLIHSA